MRGEAPPTEDLIALGFGSMLPTHRITGPIAAEAVVQGAGGVEGAQGEAPGEEAGELGTRIGRIQPLHRIREGQTTLTLPEMPGKEPPATGREN